MGLFSYLKGWRFVSKGTMDYAGNKLKLKDHKLPKWLYGKEFPYTADVKYYLKGNHFKYKLIVTRPGEQGSAFQYEIFRKKRKN